MLYGPIGASQRLKQRVLQQNFYSYSMRHAASLFYAQDAYIVGDHFWQHESRLTATAVTLGAALLLKARTHVKLAPILSNTLQCE